MAEADKQMIIKNRPQAMNRYEENFVKWLRLALETVKPDGAIIHVPAGYHVISNFTAFEYSQETLEAEK